VQDITARRAAEVELRDLAFRDTLTGLPNRRQFSDCLARAVERSKRHPRSGFAVMFLDFDRFKLINDSLGHGAGDEFLVQVARRVHQSLRPSDVVARLGGDEFAFLVQDIEHLNDVLGFAERVLATVRQPFDVAGTVINASASIGVTFSAFGYESPESVLRDADIAMYRAKAAGKDCYAVFDTSLHTEVARRLQLERDLRAAIDNGQVWVAYQPLFDINTNRIVAFEALARWSHPRRGAIGPHIFVPIAEESGLIGRLTALVLERACRELARWQQLDPALSMHVNVSGKDLEKPDLATRICGAIAHAQIDPRSLTIEVTESALMESVEAARKTVAALRALGVGISIDDFGTGYSSLARIGSLPIDSLKVDRSFVAGLGAESNQSVITRAIVSLGLSLGKEVIAEGIEEPSQLQQLRAMGCRIGQGHIMSRPITAEAAETLLARNLEHASEALRARLV
jgi:diguanylate cyclase (GGDEF)-like protein